MSVPRDAPSREQRTFAEILLKAWLKFVLFATAFALIGGFFDAMDATSTGYSLSPVEFIRYVTGHRESVIILILILAIPSAILALVAKMGRAKN